MTVHLDKYDNVIILEHGSISRLQPEAATATLVKVYESAPHGCYFERYTDVDGNIWAVSNYGDIITWDDKKGAVLCTIYSGYVRSILPDDSCQFTRGFHKVGSLVNCRKEDVPS